ncbi:putative universal stress protein SAUSA300_1656 isoform X2 [Ruditapes philippinarum]|uniref:putative universal stress protein SAUSA300_1656 isoform X2 n=1 Tax=Ruditapes philippinarum TaxID=129788 RepID=UPI00295AAA27|nr:putative universal stress protein SAUSA300_1656 isoform X2 [Ruditapes philippinarum]
MTENKTEQKSARKVLIAMDGSKHALFAFEWYAKNVYKETDNVIMAYCAEYNINVPMLLASPVAVANIVEQHEEAVLKVFKKLDEIANRYKIKHTLERIERPHRPGEAIVKAAHQQNIDLIITGTRGLGTIRRTILGSVSDYIIHHARVPVIVCKHGDHI